VCAGFANCVFVQLITDDLSGEVMVAPSKKLEDLIHLAELCVDLLQQNEEHYAEVGLVQFLVVSVGHHTRGKGSQKIRFSILLPPNNFTQ
jgi:hypothetical protein